jgi:hypothetical protein
VSPPTKDLKQRKEAHSEVSNTKSRERSQGPLSLEPGSANDLEDESANDTEDPSVDEFEDASEHANDSTSKEESQYQTSDVPHDEQSIQEQAEEAFMNDGDKEEFTEDSERGGSRHEIP